MKNKTLALSFACMALINFTGAMKVEELSLNRATESQNMQIIPNEIANDLSKHYITNDINETYYNLRDKETKDVIDRLPWPEAASINAYYHQLSIDKLLGFSSEPKKISLLEIIERNTPNTNSVNSTESYLSVLRPFYNKMFNEYYTINVIGKKEGTVKFVVGNNSKFNIKGVMFNVRLLDKTTGTVVIDELVKKNFVTKLKPNYEMNVSNNFTSKNPEWDSRQEGDLVWLVNTIAVTLENGSYINIDDLYDMQTKSSRDFIKP